MAHSYADFILQLFCKTAFMFILDTTMEEKKKEVTSPQIQIYGVDGNEKA